MSGKSHVVAIEKKVISLIRQKCLLKFGSGTCNEKQIRKLTQFEDLQRCLQVKIATLRYKKYYKFRQIKLKQIQWSEHVKILSELQAGNCSQMAKLTYIILCKIVPPGIKVEKRLTQDVKGDIQTNHQFVSLKPLSAVNQHETLVIDPWPSNQIINPEIVSHRDHFANKQNQTIYEQYSKQSAQLSKQHYMNFDFVKQNDFDLEFLSKVENVIDKKQYLDDSLWNFFKEQEYNYDIYDVMADEKMWQQFKSKRRNVKNVTKNQK